MMKFTRKFHQFAALVSVAAIAALATSGCAGSAPKTGTAAKTGSAPKTTSAKKSAMTPVAPESGGEMLSQPRWLSEGCEAFWNDKAEDRLCAVGSAAGTYNMATLRTTAERRARNRIAQVLEPEVKALVEHYANSHQGHEDFGNPPDLERARNLSKMLTEHAVLESQITSIWVPANNRMQVLVSLDVTGFQRTVRDMPQLSEKLREELLKRAEKGFKLIEQLEEEKS